MPSRTCPDCDVSMEPVGHQTTYNGDGIRIDTDGGLLGALDLRDSTSVGRTCRRTSASPADSSGFTPNEHYSRIVISTASKVSAAGCAGFG